MLNTAVGPDVAYALPVYATWEISFSVLSALAQNMLNVMSFFYREGITEELFRIAVTSPRPQSPFRSTAGEDPAPLTFILSHLRDGNGELDGVSLLNTMHELRSYSLIQEPFEGTFSFHPLVHAWARERQDRDSWLASRSSALRILFRHDVSSMTQDALKTFAPHFFFCESFMRKELAEFIYWVSLLHYSSNSDPTSQ